MFSYGNETKYILSEANYIESFFLHVIRYIETTQKPHVHLFQKSELPGIASVLPK